VIGNDVNSWNIIQGEESKLIFEQFLNNNTEKTLKIKLNESNKKKLLIQFQKTK
jgi:hypothetical protein